MTDFLIRQKISTTINFFYLETLPMPRPQTSRDEFQELAERAAHLVSFTPEIQLARPALDLGERAQLRAEIDAIVAGLYDLSPTEFAYILTTFASLDRDQPPLPDDCSSAGTNKASRSLSPLLRNPRYGVASLLPSSRNRPAGRPGNLVP